MTTVTDLIRKLRATDNRRVVQAVDELRRHGWLADGSLQGVPLCHAHLEWANLRGADLRRVDFHQACLAAADLSGADLAAAKLTRVDLRDAVLKGANLSGADLFKSDLTGVRFLADEQLAQARRLWGAIMPDGELYDGRYNLPGDLEFARWGRVDIHDPEAMAEFFRIPLETYLKGQREITAVAEPAL
jgi:hypothetical protein